MRILLKIWFMYCTAITWQYVLRQYESQKFWIKYRKCFTPFQALTFRTYYMHLMSGDDKIIVAHTGAVNVIPVTERNNSV